jgi:hypothetical protein
MHLLQIYPLNWVQLGTKVDTYYYQDMEGLYVAHICTASLHMTV